MAKLKCYEKIIALCNTLELLNNGAIQLDTTIWCSKEIIKLMRKRKEVKEYKNPNRRIIVERNITNCLIILIGVFLIENQNEVQLPEESKLYLKACLKKVL